MSTNQTIDPIISFLEDDFIIEITKTYLGKKNELMKEEDLNIFSLVSEKYRYENLHSKIISTFLNPAGTHRQGYVFLKKFLELANELPLITDRNQPLNSIDLDNYKKVKVETEKGRIDISIKDEESKRAIIIENKINNAGDTYRQIPDYYEALSGSGFEIDAIIYLTPNSYKSPDRTTWGECAPEIDEKLVRLSAFEDGDKLSLYKWLVDCKQTDGLSENNKKIKNNNEILNQYSNLIKKISESQMNNLQTNVFLDKIISENNNVDSTFYETAKTVCEMMQFLPQTMGRKIFDELGKFKNLPDPKLWEKDTVLIYEYIKVETRQFDLKIKCEQEGICLKFYDLDFKNSGTTNAQKLVQEFELKDLEENGSDELEIKFIFPKQYQECIDFAKKFLNALSNKIGTKN